jgi:hypothetical protein
VRPALLLTAAAAAAAVVTALLPTTPAAADITTSQTWVSGVGDDVNPCERTAPCKTFAGAISKTAASGSINVLDPGGFGQVTITKAVTIDGTGSFGSILASSGYGIIVNAGVDDDVVLRNLDLSGTSCNATTGIRILGGGSVTLDHVRIGGFQTAISYTGTGNTAPTFRLAATHVGLASDCTSGIDLNPAAGHPVEAVLTDSSITGSGTAVKVAAGATLSVSRSTITGNQTGVDTSAGGTVHAGCDTTITANSSNGAVTDTVCATGGSASPATAGPMAPTTTATTGGAIRTWISGVGDDANPCSRTAPCRTLAGAAPKTSAGGYVDALDPVTSDQLTLTKALTIDGSASYLGIRTISGAGIVINAGPHDDVVLRDLELDGVGCTGTTGIRILGGRSLTLDHVHINGFGTAISYEGTTATPFTLTASSLDIGGTCDTGLQLPSGASHPVQVTLVDTIIATSGTGVEAGPGAEVWATRTTIALNAIGLAGSGGKVHAGCDTELVGNGNDGAFTDNTCATPVVKATIGNTAKPTIAGHAIIGQTLTASPGMWDTPDAAFAYQWSAGGTAIPGATGSIYTPTAGDKGKRLTVTVTAVKAGYAADVAVSEATAPVVAAPATNPTNTATTTGGKVTYCVVPRLLNKSSAAARRSLTAAGCQVGTKRRHAAPRKRGKVLTQSIPAGVSVKRGTKVIVTIGR